MWFSSRLLREVFGWEDLESCEPRRIEEALYPISHQAFGGKVPVLLTPVESGMLDQGSKAYGQDGRRRSPNSCLQECLNADDSSEWGVLCNGSTLRLLHDNPALVKPAYVQVELGAIFDGGLFDEFALLWLLVHASRLAPDGDGRCRLDAWLELGQQSGELALNRLRDGVQTALEELGEGFLRHPANWELHRRLESGELSTMDFFRQLLRLMYRLLFLCSAEDRKLLFPPGVPFRIQQVYHEGYSLSRLRDLAIRSGALEHQHSDLWKVQVLMFRELEKETGSELGLPALGGLFDKDRCADLDSSQLSNAALLAAVRAIGWFYDEQSQSRTRINYAAMNTEEFGSVYESLLELHPQIRPQGGALRFSQPLMTDEALLRELGHRIAQQRLDRNLSQAQLAEQAGISKRTLERLEAGAAATQLSLFLRVLRQLDLLERLDLLLPEPQPSPLALLELQKAGRKRASRRRIAKPTGSWSWGQP